MAKPIKDFSVNLPESVHAALDAEAEAFGKTMQVVAREVLQDWADRKHHAYKVYARRLRTNGLQTEFDGFEPEDDGTPRKGSRR